MITVTVAINGQVIYARTAIYIGRKGDTYLYLVDTEEVLERKPTDGAVLLAKMMLDTIHDQKQKKIVP